MKNSHSAILSHILKLTQHNYSHAGILSDICTLIFEKLNISILIINKNSKILANTTYDFVDINYIIHQSLDLMEAEKFLYDGQLLNASSKNINAVILPIFCNLSRQAIIFICKHQDFLIEDDLCLIDVLNIIFTLIFRGIYDEISSIENKKAELTKSALGTLSYSELIAVINVFKNLNNNIVVASKVAKKIGISRSIIVNALRKLESAALIEVRSLGTKGTYIRIINSALTTELSKLYD